QEEIGKTKARGEALTWEDLTKMKYTWRVASEVLRITPTVSLSFRQAKQDIEYDGFLIPKGWQVLLSSFMTHVDSDIFENPTKFDPSRFEKQAPSPPPFSYIAFGGGPRMCPVWSSRPQKSKLPRYPQSVHMMLVKNVIITSSKVKASKVSTKCSYDAGKELTCRMYTTSSSVSSLVHTPVVVVSPITSLRTLLLKHKITTLVFPKCISISERYKLPPSYYAIKKTIKTIRLGYESIHACEHDCCLFRGDDNKDLDFCPVCNMSRWKDSNTLGKKVPKKVLRYFSIIPRLQRLYKSSHTAKEMIWHATGKCTEPGLQHLADDIDDIQSASVVMYERELFYADIVNSWHKSPRMDINVYLRPLTEDLKVLWDRKGVETIDVASGQKFNMRAMVLWTINDFSARSSLSGWSGHCYKACPTCNKDTPFVRVLTKTAYVGHIRFLKKPHKWRSSHEFNGQTDNRDLPKEFGRDEILAQLDRLPTRLTGKHLSFRGVKIKRNVLVELNWTKRSIFYRLEYWSFLKLRHNLDIMHIKKNVLEAILNTLLMNDKSKDTVKHKVIDNDTNITGLKSNDFHIMMQRLLSYGLQNYLPDNIAKPIIELCSLFKQICSATSMEDDMLKAQIKVVDILCDLELIYPPSLFYIMIHLVIHLTLEALEGWPIRPRWMFPFERYMKKLKGYVRNKDKPEGSIAKGYVAEEALTFSSHYFRDVTTKFNLLDRNVDLPPPTCQFQVFRSVCKSIGLRSVIRFDAQELKKVKCLFPSKDMKEEFPDWFGS
nr:hypothetical protein [Tanacetum cinerariifolium]